MGGVLHATHPKTHPFSASYTKRHRNQPRAYDGSSPRPNFAQCTCTGGIYRPARTLTDLFLQLVTGDLGHL